MDASAKVGCGNSVMILRMDAGQSTRYRSFPLRCHAWDCPLCAKQKAEMYRVRMRPLFARENLHMYTFTYYHSKSPMEVWLEYSKAWNRMRTAIVKRFGETHYCRVLESHKKSPYPHLHVIMDRHLPADWLNRELISAGFGYQCEQHPVTDSQAALYITKYLTKVWPREDSILFRKAARARIISFSRGVCDPKTGPSGWHIVGIAGDMETAIERVLTEGNWGGSGRAEITFEQKWTDFHEVTFTYKKELQSG